MISKDIKILNINNPNHIPALYSNKHEIRVNGWGDVLINFMEGDNVIGSIGISKVLAKDLIWNLKRKLVASPASPSQGGPESKGKE